MSNTKTVESFLEKSGASREALVLLRKILLSIGLEETIKWGSPVYTMDNKNIVGMGAFQSYTGLWFFQGSLLKDQENKLINAQEGVTKALRQWRFQSVEEILACEAIIRDYVKEAVANQSKGIVIKPARNKPLVIPAELLDLFHADPQLKQSFEALSLSKRRDFAEYICEARQVATKQKRLEKIRPLILLGVGLNDKYKE